MPRAYLTIDDGPSESFQSLVDFLYDRKIPALFFNRGDAMEKNPDAVRYGIEKGYTMANHAYSHRRFSKLPLEKCFEEIGKTEKILDDIYWSIGRDRTSQYFRFPYMDRGMGPWLVEPDALPEQHKGDHHILLESGLGHQPEKPELCQIHKKREIQKYLQERGFEKLTAQDVTIPWYAETEMAEAIDALCTFSTSDWALLERHKGKHGFESVEDLKTKIDDDKSLRDEGSAHIILAHDHEEIHEVTTTLIDHLLSKNFEFLDF